MAKIAFLLMAHKGPGDVIAQAKALTAHGDAVVIHYDARAGREGYNEIRTALKGNPNIGFAKRVRGGWGTWSLVQASLNMIRAAKRFQGITHYYLISGDCYPTKSRSFIERMLAEAPHTDFIEVNDFYSSGWIRTGLRDERLIYRHWFNERE
ncbi:MAG: beta-1,6-N-acetylglucosaminyltransferase, partial [Pseudomonadota bacterium]